MGYYFSPPPLSNKIFKLCFDLRYCGYFPIPTPSAWWRILCHVRYVPRGKPCVAVVLLLFSNDTKCGKSCPIVPWGCDRERGKYRCWTAGAEPNPEAHRITFPFCMCLFFFLEMCHKATIRCLHFPLMIAVTNVAERKHVNAVLGAELMNTRTTIHAVVLLAWMFSAAFKVCLFSLLKR